MTKKTRTAPDRRRPDEGERRAHDPETTIARGMSTEGVEVDEAETMASTGNAANSFREIASGTATGVGLDREEIAGTGGLAAGEDVEGVDEDSESVAESGSGRRNERASYFGAGASAERPSSGEEADEENARSLAPDEEPRED